MSCGLTDRELTDRYDLLIRTGNAEEEETEVEDTDESEEEAGITSGSKVRLKAWNQRTRKSLGESSDGKPARLIDQVHRLMHLWRGGDVIKVDEFLDSSALRRSSLFNQLLQALIELSPAASEERSILESLSNHIVARGIAYEDKQLSLSSSGRNLR
jgi:hypothetical protein